MTKIGKCVIPTMRRRSQRLTKERIRDAKTMENDEMKRDYFAKLYEYFIIKNKQWFQVQIFPQMKTSSSAKKGKNTQQP